MSFAVVVITSNNAIATYIGTKKSAVIPVEMRKHLHFEMNKIHAISYLDRRRDPAGLEDYLVSAANTSTGVILLCEDRLFDLVRPFSTAFFTYSYDSNLEGKNVQNFFTMVMSRVLKAFLHYSQRFDDEKNRKLFLLPFRNFSGKDLNDLREVFYDGIRLNEYYNDMDRMLGLLRNRQRPKTSTNKGKEYIIDDKDWYFEYGKEKHARLETKCPPHQKLCELCGNYRFGRRFDSERHFNVSEESGRISGRFCDCHDVPDSISKQTHVNVFSNDYYT